MARLKIISLAIILILSTQFAAAQTNPPNPCDPAQQGIILQYVSDQITILQNAGVSVMPGLSADDNKSFLTLWAKSYLAQMCQTPANLGPRLTNLETTVRTLTGGIDLSGINQQLASLQASMNQLAGVPASMASMSNQITFLNTAVSGDQATVTTLQASVAALNSRITQLTTGTACITNVTLASTANGYNAYKITWQSDVPSSAYLKWGYGSGNYAYQSGVSPSGQNSIVLYANRGVPIYVKVVATQSMSGVVSETSEVMLRTN
jgi:hypothetical protein